MNTTDDNTNYEAKAQTVINEVFKRTNIKMDSNDPFVVLFVSMQDMYYQGLYSALNSQKEAWEEAHKSFLTNIDERVEKLNEATKKLENQKEAIVVELVNQNKTNVQKLFFDRLEKNQRQQNLILIGVIALLIILGLIMR